MRPSAWTPYYIDDVRRGRRLLGSTASRGRPEWQGRGMPQPGKGIRVGSYHFVHSIMAQGEASSDLAGKERGVTEIWVVGRCYLLCGIGSGSGLGCTRHGPGPRLHCVYLGTQSGWNSEPWLLSTYQLGVQDPGTDTFTGGPKGQRHCGVCSGLSQPVLRIFHAQAFCHLVSTW